MSFGAMAAWQAWLLLATAGGVAAWLFLLKLRPPRVLVPSLLLWRRVLDESREMTLWERIRRAVSLMLSILIAVALALAIVRPSGVGVAANASRGRMLIVLDSSWSMLTRTSSGETRWDRALAETRRLAAAAAGDPVMLATTADGLVEGPTTDLALIETGLDRISASGGEGSAWPRMAGTQVVHFITDGVVPRPLDPGVIVNSVFEAAPNVAITALDVRPALESGRVADAYLEIANFAPGAQTIRLVIQRGAITVFDRQLDVERGAALRQVVPIAAAGDPLLRARIEAPHNALSIDDEALGWVRQARPLSVVIVGTETEWLEALLRQDANLRASLANPATYRAAQEDVVIFDRCAPKEPPTRPALYFAPPAGTSWLNAERSSGSPESEERHPRWNTGGGHPLLHGVDPLTLAIDRVRVYDAPALVPVTRSERGTPVIYVEEAAGRRGVVVAFGPGDSNLTSAPAFPVFIGNALEWLARPDFGGVRRPGEVVLDEAVATVTGPRGVRVSIQRVGHAVMAVLRGPGLYVAEGGSTRSTFAVNVGDPQVSNVERTTLPVGRTRGVAAGASTHAWWLYCGLAAFALILLEWWTWQRRITV